MVGYGAKPPHANWPQNARIAVQFVLNYEKGSENNVLHGDDGSEQFLSEIIGAPSFPARHMSMESFMNTARALVYGEYYVNLNLASFL
jgi:allantoinase